MGYPPRVTWSRLSPILLLALAASGCEDEPAFLVVDIRSDLLPGVEVDAARVEVAGGVGREDRVLTASTDLLGGVRVAQLDVGPGTVEFEVTLLRAGTVVASRPVRQVLSAPTAVTVFLQRTCRTVSCPPERACYAGGCVNAGCSVNDPAACQSSECEVDGDCAPLSDCAVPHCDLGACFYERGVCAGGGVCDLEQGCRMGVDGGDPFDAGRIDGGEEDGAVDSGRDAGQPGLFETRWEVVRAALEAAAAAALSNPASVDTFGGLNPGGTKWAGGALAPNGRIYAVPFGASAVLEIDPAGRALETFGEIPVVLDGAYIGAVLAPNGRIYGIPFRAGRVLEIDPENRSIRQFGTVNGSYTGAVLMPDGRIFAAPNGAGSVLAIDPETRSVRSFGTIPLESRFQGAALTPDGDLIAFPRNGDMLLRVTVDEEVSLEPVEPLDMTSALHGGVITPNGTVVSIPSTASEIITVAPNGEVDWFSSTRGPGEAWAFGGLAPNGLVYGAPRDASGVLEIDLDTSRTREFGLFTGNDKWIGLIPGLDGKLYGIPWNATEVLVVDPAAEVTLPARVVLSPWLNHT